MTAVKRSMDAASQDDITRAISVWRLFPNLGMLPEAGVLPVLKLVQVLWLGRSQIKEEKFRFELVLFSKRSLQKQADA